MGFYLNRQVWETSQHKGTALLVLLAIADFIDDKTGVAWPSVETIAKKTRMKVRNVQANLAKLTASGELIIEQAAGPMGCNRYRIAVAGVQTFAPGGAIFGTEGCNSTSKGVQSFAPKLNGTIKELNGGIEVNLKAAPAEELQPADHPQASHEKQADTLIAVEPQSLDCSAPPPAAKPRDELAVALAEVCRIDPDLASAKQRANLNAAYKLLKAAGHTADEVRAVGKWWWKHDWRAIKNGSPPTPAQVGEVWAEAMAAQPKPQAAPAPVEELPPCEPGAVSRLRAKMDAERGGYWLPKEQREQGQVAA